MTVVVGPPVGVEKSPMIGAEAKVGEEETALKEFDFDGMIRELGDDSFTAQPVKTAISLLASKLNLMREVLERIHPGYISVAIEQEAERKRIEQLEKHQVERNDHYMRFVEMCATFSNVLFSLVWFTILVFLDWKPLGFALGSWTLGGLLGTLVLGTYCHENARYARETRQYNRAAMFGIFDAGFVVGIPLAVSAGLLKINNLYGNGMIPEGFSLLDALAMVPGIPIAIVILIVAASLSTVALTSKNKITRQFWTRDRIVKNTVEYERMQVFWLIIHTVGNIVVVREALYVSLMLVALVGVERIAALAESGIEQKRRCKLVPFICFNFMALVASGVLVVLYPLVWIDALPLALTFTPALNLVLTVARWREFGAKLPLETENCVI